MPRKNSKESRRQKPRPESRNPYHRAMAEKRKAMYRDWVRSGDSFGVMARRWCVSRQRIHAICMRFHYYGF